MLGFGSKKDKVVETTAVAATRLTARHISFSGDAPSYLDKKGFMERLGGFLSGGVFGNAKMAAYDHHEDAYTLISCCREIAAKSPIVASYVNAIQNNITSPSPSVSFICESKSEKDKEGLDKIKMLWEKWRADKSNFSSTVTAESFDQMLIAGVMIGGDAVVLPYKKKDGKMGVQYVPAEFIGSSKMDGWDSEHAYGVGRDKYGNIDAVYLKKEVGYNRIAIQDCIFIRHNPIPLRERGLPAIAPVLEYIARLDRLDNDFLKITALAAKLQGILVGGTSEAAKSGVSTAKLDAGNIKIFDKELMDEGGAIFHQMDSKMPNQSVVAMRHQMMMTVSAALGVAYETLVHDFSKANFASSRGAFLLERDMYVKMGRWWQDEYLRPLFNFWWHMQGSKEAAAAGVNITDAILTAVSKPKFDTRGWESVDPKKTAEAYLLLLKDGIISRETIANKMGFDWEREQTRLEGESKKEEKVVDNEEEE
jgi:hypothetical protein